MSISDSAINRRNFVTGAASTAALAAVAGLAGIAAADEPADAAGADAASADVANGDSAPFEATVDWDAEYDVVVVGLGGAGCATAITAADLGSRVLVLEKACEGNSGGNSNVCMQFMGWTDDVPRMVEYMKWMRGGYETPSDEMIQLYVEEMAKNKEFFEYLGASDTTSFEMPEFPMCEYVDAFKPFTTNGYYGVRPGENFGGDGQTYALLKRNVVDRSDLIDVWYEAPATHLIQDPATKIVHGVEAEVDGQAVKVRAKNGVVLACGGFENNVRMQQDYFGNTFWPSLGRALWNEGDGIRMAQEVGAQLWHMDNRATCNGEFYDPATQTPTMVFMNYAASFGIVVGDDGTRIDESHVIYPIGNPGYAHGKVWNHGMFTQPALPDNMWYVYDQAILDKGQIHASWSVDGSDEMEKGWIQKADTLEEIAQLIGLDETATERFMKTVEDYNGFCAEGDDKQYGRTQALEPIATAPFYLIKLTARTVNTQGGPERGLGGEVIDTEGNPIPHLYEAGELGDIWSNLYQAGNNLGGGMIFGRISGRNAAAVKDDVTQDDLVAEGEGFQPTVVETEYECGENQYIGRGLGKSPAPIVVRVTLDGDTIANVEILEHYETSGLIRVEQALERMPQAMVEANSPTVDIVTNATRTGAGIIAAVYDALEQAGL